MNRKVWPSISSENPQISEHILTRRNAHTPRNAARMPEDRHCSSHAPDVEGSDPAGPPQWEVGVTYRRDSSKAPMIADLMAYLRGASHAEGT